MILSTNTSRYTHQCFGVELLRPVDGVVFHSVSLVLESDRWRDISLCPAGVRLFNVWMFVTSATVRFPESPRTDIHTQPVCKRCGFDEWAAGDVSQVKGCIHKDWFFILIIFCHFNMQISMKEQRFQFWLLIYVSGSTYMCFNPKWNGPSFILELAVFNLCGPKLRGGTARLPACCCTDRLLIWFGCPTTDPTPLPFSTYPLCSSRLEWALGQGWGSSISRFFNSGTLQRFWVSLCPGARQKAPVV